MHFEVKLPGNSHLGALRAAGIDTAGYAALWIETRVKPVTLPVQLACRYTYSQEPIVVYITVIQFGGSLKHDGHLRIEVDDDVIGKKLCEKIVKYAETWRGVGIDAPEHKRLWARIEEILERDEITLQKLESKQGVLSRRAIEALMQLCDETELKRKIDIYHLFNHHWVTRADRSFTASWLIKLFEKVNLPSEQIGVRIWELAVPAIADDLIRLIQEPRYGDRRGILCLALAKTKHPRAAEIIAAVAGETGVTRWAIEALGKLKAAEQATVVKKFLADRDPEIRREAKKTLKKMGLPVEASPPSVHLVKNRRLLPKGLDEWSANLDVEDLKPTLQALSGFVESGFGPLEIAEVAGVMDEMEPEQTKAFRFQVVANEQKSELWLVIFMDDIDSPDLEIHAAPELIRKLHQSLPERD